MTVRVFFPILWPSCHILPSENYKATTKYNKYSWILCKEGITTTRSNTKTKLTLQRYINAIHFQSCLIFSKQKLFARASTGHQLGINVLQVTRRRGSFDGKLVVPPSLAVFAVRAQCGAPWHCGGLQCIPIISNMCPMCFDKWKVHLSEFCHVTFRTSQTERDLNRIKFMVFLSLRVASYSCSPPARLAEHVRFDESCFRVCLWIKIMDLKLGYSKDGSFSTWCQIRPVLSHWCSRLC